MVEDEGEERYAKTQVLEESDKHEAGETTEESIRVGVKETEGKEELDKVHKETTDGARAGRILEGASSEGKQRRVGEVDQQEDTSERTEIMLENSTRTTEVKNVYISQGEAGV